jgi:UDP-GlcNAc:undecaprenyl-phosphate/decaprenyl-phosphate GlcNAc-1-phosphate transferase
VPKHGIYSASLPFALVTYVAALLALPVSAAAIWLALRSPLGARLAREPGGDRWRTDRTPLVGGIGIALGFAAAVGVALATGAVDSSSEVLGILAGCALLFAAGLADDLWSLPPLAKLGAQGAATAIVLASGLSVEIVENDVLALALAVVWLIGMTNAFNLLDNMDGLAATLAAIACAYFAVDAVTVHPSDTVLVLSLGLGLACVGFLPFNVRPGRPAAAFMGDSGSQTIGFALAAIGLLASWNVAGTTVATLLLPILILAVPIVDTALVTVVRLLEGRPIAQGGRDHASHRIVYRGLSERRALVLLAVISAALGATSLAYNVLDNARIAVVGVLLTFAGLVQFASFLADVERTPETARLHSPLALYRRRLIELLVDAALVIAALVGAFLLRVDGSGTINQRHILTIAIPVVLAARFAMFIPFGLYRGVWRYASSGDAARVVLAVGASELIAFAFLEATRDLGDFPRSVFLIDALLCTVLVGLSRFGERALARGFSSLRARSDRRRTVIVGAGRAGGSLLRELRETPGEHVVGFVDDDARLRGRRLLGVPVLGGSDAVARALAASRPDAVLVTIPDAPRDVLDAVVRACGDAGVPCRFVRREVDLDPHAVLAAK